MIRTKSFGVMAAALLLLVLPVSLSAHGIGVSYEENKDGYLIDIGHDEFIAALESTRFDFQVYPLDISTVENEVFTDVWVTFTKDRQIYFAGGIHKPEYGATGFTYVFPEVGTYTVSVRFQNTGKTVVQTEFTLDIIAPLKEQRKANILVLLGLLVTAGTIAGVAVGLFVPRKNKLT